MSIELPPRIIPPQATIEAQAAYIDELQAENAALRASLANGQGPCVYCSLPREEWAKCKSGFPGCARGDDAMRCPHVGAELESQEQVAALRAQVESLTAALAAQPAPQAEPTQAPWGDFLGQPIRHGDRLTHPDGSEFTAIRLNGWTDEGDAWRAVYDLDPVYVSRLVLQIGDKGRAVLATAPKPAEPTQAQLDAMMNCLIGYVMTHAEVRAIWKAAHSHE